MSDVIRGLSVTHSQDGCWMRFNASNGKQAAINLTLWANERHGMIGDVILQWIEDVRPGEQEARDEQA